jgi:hypothetical protein
MNTPEDTYTHSQQSKFCMIAINSETPQLKRQKQNLETLQDSENLIPMLTPPIHPKHTDIRHGENEDVMGNGHIPSERVVSVEHCGPKYQVQSGRKNPMCHGQASTTRCPLRLVDIGGSI